MKKSPSKNTERDMKNIKDKAEKAIFDRATGNKQSLSNILFCEPNSDILVDEPK